MTLAILLLAAFPALIAVLMFLAVAFGFEVLQFPGAPAEAYMLIHIGSLLGIAFTAITLYMLRWAAVSTKRLDELWTEAR